ncbi:MAG: hypothetical protein K2N30_02580 [Clostridia bacterium]|nr:hypothetical protein [Clostridia bacterium]
MDEELTKALYVLSGILMANEQREAEAVEGYNQQLKAIAEVQDKLLGTEENSELVSFLDTLEAATKEKISDELNHGQSLYEEYVQMTGIQPAKE